MDPRFEEVEYPGFGGDGDGWVAYKIIRKEVFFAGLIREATSTINAAEDIIRAICKAEEISWQDFTFVDIQTHRGYQKAPGEFKANVLKLGSGEELSVESWQPISLTKKVRQLFDDMIMK